MSDIKNLITSIDNYLKENFIDLSDAKYSIQLTDHKSLIDRILEKFQKSFANYLFDLIKKKNLSEVEVYKKAHLNRRIFSKLRHEKDYKPSKQTILAIAFGMELNLDEAKNLLEKGGYALSIFDKYDVIIKYFFENQVYDLFLINEVLDYYNFKPLGD